MLETVAVCLIPQGTATALTRKQEAVEQNRRKTSLPGRRTAQPSTAAPADDEELEEYEDEVVLSENCPEANGYFPDSQQCDKYHDCRDGKSTVRLCPDGLVFNDYDPAVEKCDLPFGIDCSKRPKLREFSKLFNFLFFSSFPTYSSLQNGKAEKNPSIIPNHRRNRQHFYWLQLFLLTQLMIVFQRSHNRLPIVHECTDISPMRIQEYATYFITASKENST